MWRMIPQTHWLSFSLHSFSQLLSVMEPKEKKIKKEKEKKKTQRKYKDADQDLGRKKKYRPEANKPSLVAMLVYPYCFRMCPFNHLHWLCNILVPR
ncbi:hypothetical protein BDV25DRAFT_146916 [Aspergillus avenaceus]|uniref:Uncharacterized protein n=1 Tax=Aspergillus avenaceus TaxID=36643 RepID=A0A5N6U8Z7_ASPAV|nr:hypothetical protein BDV25DRAFT_146916 [Aspergillus avenaceus]